jgi:hypothetical protein
MFDWIPDEQPQRGLVVFVLVLALSALVVVPLSVAGGDDEPSGSFSESVTTVPKPEHARTAPPPTPPPPPTTPTTPPPAAEPAPRPPVERPVGGTATDDDVEFTVNSLRSVSKIKRGSYYKNDYEPPRGGKLIAAEVTFVNHTNKPLDPFCGGNSAALVDQKGRAHETLDDLYSIEGNDAVCGSAGTLAGDKATVVLAFKLKPGERVDHLDLWNGKYEPDFDGETSRVRFRPTT